MTRRKIPKNEPGELLWDMRVELAVKECRARLAAGKDPAFRALERHYSIDWSRIQDRINRGQGTRKDYAQAH